MQDNKYRRLLANLKGIDKDLGKVSLRLSHVKEMILFRRLSIQMGVAETGSEDNLNLLRLT